MSKTKTKDRLTPRAGSPGHERRSPPAGDNQQNRMLSQVGWFGSKLSQCIMKERPD